MPDEGGTEEGWKGGILRSYFLSSAENTVGGRDVMGKNLSGGKYHDSMG